LAAETVTGTGSFAQLAADAHPETAIERTRL